MAHLLLQLCVVATALCHRIYCETCSFAKHPSLPARSCSHVIDVQPSCYEESGFFWVIGANGTLENVYCDMVHKGGGWRRILYYHSDINSSCPTGLVETWLPQWDGMQYNQHLTCHKILKKEKEIITHKIPNTENLQITEIRGYATLKARLYTVPSAFSYSNDLEQGVADGLEIVIGETETSGLRNIFAYVLGSINSRPEVCPINWDHGDEYSETRLNYRDYQYACDELYLLTGVDGMVYAWPELYGFYCTQCPAGAPWFEQRFAKPFNFNHSIYIRLVDVDDVADHYAIYLFDIELYVR